MFNVTCYYWTAGKICSNSVCMFSGVINHLGWNRFIQLLTADFILFNNTIGSDRHKDGEVVSSLIWKAFHSACSFSGRPTVARRLTALTTWSKGINLFSQRSAWIFIHKFYPYSCETQPIITLFMHFPTCSNSSGMSRRRPKRPWTLA